VADHGGVALTLAESVVETISQFEVNNDRKGK
jgi:hypothetical protein